MVDDVVVTLPPDAQVPQSPSRAQIGHESVLDGYDRERRAAAAAVLAFTDRMTKVASLRSPPGRVLRNLALRTLPRIPAIRATITTQVTGLARSPLRRRQHQPSAPTPRPGSPTPWLQSNDQ